MAYIGIDPSLSGTAVSRYGGETVRFTSENEGNDVRSRMRRYRQLAQVVAEEIASEFASPSGAELVIFIEGYSFGSKGSSFITLAEYGAILRSRLVVSFPKATIIEVAPHALKKFICGKGNADKTAVIAAIASRYQVEFRTNDEYDAYALALMAAAYGGLHECTNQSQRDVIEAIKNPKQSKKRKPKAA